ncbi:hypothetical protein Tco_0506587 [Tanacetum coccineum]
MTCNTANEMWTTIERLQQGESLNIQDVKTNLFWEFGKVTSRDGESMESYYSRFYKLIMINDIRAERIAKSANPLCTLLALAHPSFKKIFTYQAPKPQRSNSTSSSTRPSASTRHKGKEIAKPVTPQSESVSEEDSDPEQAQRDKDLKRILALHENISRTFYKPTQQQPRTVFKTPGTRLKYTKPGIRRTLQFHGKRFRRSYIKNPVSTEQPLERLQNHDEDNVFANERRHSEQPESINDTYVLEKDDSNVTPDSSNICNNDNQENKTILKQLKKANASLTQEQKECRQTLMRTGQNSRTLNVNVVCVECGKCVFNSNHDACVSKYLNDVNARTKKPKVVPISASKQKRKTNKSVATPHKKTVASDTTIQKPKSYFKELYENTNKAWKWWIENKCPLKTNGQQTTPSNLVLNGNQRVESLVMFILDQASVFMEKTSVHISSGLVLHQWCLLKITLQAPFLNVQKTFEQRSSSLVLHQMTSDHNRSELGIQDHSNEQSSSKLVPKVVP